MRSRRVIGMVLAALAVATGCGGKAGSEPYDGQLRTGIYSLVIETSEDSCDPLRSTGDQGERELIVRTREISIPDPAVEDHGAFDAPHALIPLSGTIKYQSPGGAKGSQDEVTIVRRTASSLVVDLSESWSPGAQWSAGARAECSSKRRFYFDWLRECSADDWRCRTR